MSLHNLHVVLGWAVVISNAVVGVWALAAHWVLGLRAKALWVATTVAQVLIAIQVIVGVINMRVNDIEVEGVHLFYGFVALFTVGIIYSYRQQLEQWRYLLYGFGGLFLMGLAMRSMFIPAVA
ncbi:MAG: hypothetical protein ACRBK7_27440 [Acidimicrobiales bacterium]